MLPLVGIPSTIQDALDAYRQVFCRDAGFAHISRYISGLLLSRNCQNSVLKIEKTAHF